MQYMYNNPYNDSNSVPPPYVPEMRYPQAQWASIPHESNQQTMQGYQMTTKLNKKDGHTHGHTGATTCQKGHVHLHPGVTSVPIPTKEGHVHKIWGNTTFDDGHIHYYEAYTGPQITLPNGYHTHYVEIKTTRNDGHTHTIKGFTQPSKS